MKTIGTLITRDTELLSNYHNVVINLGSGCFAFSPESMQEVDFPKSLEAYKVLAGRVSDVKQLNKIDMLDKCSRVDVKPSVKESLLEAGSIVGCAKQHVITLSHDELKDLSSIIAKDDTRYYAMMLGIKDKHVVASDGLRLVAKQVDIPDDVDCMIPGVAVKAALKIKAPKYFIKLAETGFTIMADDWVIAGSYYNKGEFPPFTSAIPNVGFSQKIPDDVEKNAILDTLKRVLISVNDTTVCYDSKLFMHFSKKSDGELYYGDIERPVKFMLKSGCFALLVPMRI